MAPKHCCCKKPGCRLDADDFNRPDAEEPGNKWEVISGEWHIQDGVLVADEPGVLATRKRHHPSFTRGAFVSEFTLANVGTGNTYRVRAGDPGADQHELTVVLTPGDPYGTAFVKLRSGTDEAEWTYIDWPAGEDVSIVFCYAPSLYLTAVVSFGSTLAFPQQVDLVISDGGEPDWKVGEKTVGNFSFLEGSFDNWTYDAHRIDRKDCPLCSCFCYEDHGGGSEDFVALPVELTLNIVNEGNCPVLPGSYPLIQGELGPTSTEDETIIIHPRPDKMTWVTPAIHCVGIPIIFPGGDIWFQLHCGGIDPVTGKTSFLLSILKSPNVSMEQDIRFNTDTTPWQPGHPGNTISDAVSLNDSSCYPLFLKFPGFFNKVAHSGNPVSPCCLGPIMDVDPGASDDYESFAGVYVTI